jgi:hypothetical protein
MNMSLNSPLVKAGIGGLLIWGATKYVSNTYAKGAIASIGAMIIAKQVPVVKDLVA